MKKRPHDLYRFYDANDVLLYVGISLNAAQRASQHKQEKAWWGDVDRMVVDHLGVITRAEAERTERDVIAAERPIHNITHNTRRFGLPGDNLGPVEFEATFLYWGEFFDLANAIQAVAQRLDRMDRDGDDVPSRRDFIHTIDGMVRSAAYGDNCDGCNETRYPVGLKLTAPTWAVCAYQCPACERHWTCGWTTDMRALGEIA